MANQSNLPFLREDFSVARVGVQGTTFSLDPLGRFLCNTWGEATDGVLNADLLRASAPFDVIGAGMYGAYCAEKVWRRGGKVLVLEAGPFLLPEHIQNLTDIGLFAPSAKSPDAPETEKPRNLVWGTSWRGNQATPGQAYCVGGKSLFWGGWSPRLTADVLEAYPPKTRTYLEQNYLAMEVQLGVRERKRGAPDAGPAEIETDFIDDTRPDSLAAILIQRVQDKHGGILVNGKPVLNEPQKAPVAVQGHSPASGLFSFDKFSTLPILAAALREDAGRARGEDVNRRLFLVPKCHVAGLGTTSGSVTRIDVFVDGAFRSLPIPSTCSVILAMSCMDSTRLALEAFPTPLMGRNLMVHLRSNIAIRIPRNKFAGLRVGAVETAALHLPGLSTKGGRFHFQIVAGANRDHNAEAIWFRTIPDVDVLNDILKNQDDNFISLQIRSCGEMLGIKDRDPRDPAGSAIYLIEEKDEFVMRRVNVHMVPNSVDNELWMEMDDAMFSLADALGDGETEIWHRGKWIELKNYPAQSKYKLSSEPESGPRDGMGTTWHECGTLWMGEDSSSSVTDPTGRFWHVSNAYCVDQSIFPRSGSANPVLTGCTLVRQTADVVAPQPIDGFPPEAGFRSLLQFRDAEPFPEGWKHFGGGGFHRWKNILETEGDDIGMLVYTAEEFTNFTLRLQWRAPRVQNNSGVYVRVPRQPNDSFDIRSGYEIQIDNTGERPGEPNSFGTQEFFNPHHQTGAIYPVHSAPGRFPEPNGKPSMRNIPTRALGEWNDFEITVRDNRIKVILNGTEVLDGGDYEDRNNIYPKGHIALQNHPKGFRVQFRNVRIREE